MRDYAFYNVGCTEAKGLRQLVVPFRRLIRRLLRPMLVRQSELYRELDAEIQALKHQQTEIVAAIERFNTFFDDLVRRQDHLDHRLRETQAFGWDHLAVVRRLARIEDRLEALQGTESAETNALTLRTFPSARWGSTDEGAASRPRASES